MNANQKKLEQYLNKKYLEQKINLNYVNRINGINKYIFIII